MNVQNINNNVSNEYVKQTLKPKSHEPVANAVNAPDIKTKPFEDYEDIYEDKSEEQSAGIYKVTPDKEGNPKIEFNDPNKKPEQSKAANPNKKAPNTDSPDKSNPDKKTEKCIANTDKVDREIKKLKAKKKKLEQQIKSLNDPEKIQALEKQLAQVKSQLQLKDNDAYRRRSTTFN